MEARTRMCAIPHGVWDEWKMDGTGLDTDFSGLRDARDIFGPGKDAKNPQKEEKSAACVVPCMD